MAYKTNLYIVAPSAYAGQPIMLPATRVIWNEGEIGETEVTIPERPLWPDGQNDPQSLLDLAIPVRYNIAQTQLIFKQEFTLPELVQLRGLTPNVLNHAEASALMDTEPWSGPEGA